MSFEIPDHLKGEPYVLELTQEIHALIHENGILHQRLKIQSATIDKLLLGNKSNSDNNYCRQGDINNDNTDDETENKNSDGNTLDVDEALHETLKRAPPPPPPSPPSSTKKSKQSKRAKQSPKRGGIPTKPVDALVMLELERLKLLKKTGKAGKFPDTFAARIHKRERQKEKREVAIQEDRARFREIQYSESGEPVNDESLYKKTMRTSPMKEVKPSIRNEISNMSHSAHLKGAKINHAHEIMSADTVAKRAEVMAEKTLKNMAFGRRESEAVGRHGYQLMHHNLGAEAFMGESYAGNLSTYTHSDSHHHEKLVDVKEKLKIDKMKRSKKNLERRYNKSSNISVSRSSNNIKKSRMGEKISGSVPKAFGRRVSVAGTRSAHLVTHHLLGANSFVGERYNQYHSVKTGRLDRKIISSPPPTDKIENGSMTLEEIAETDEYEYE
eukprot:g1085.t1